MIKIYSLGSSSSGNCFYIYDGYSYLIVDAGFSEKEIKDGLIKIGGTFEKVSGILLTHEHKDHSKGVGVFKSIKKYMTEGTFEGLQNKFKNKVETKTIEFVSKLKMFKVGDYKIKAFEAFHDTNDPVNFLIENISGEKIVYITDTGKQPNLVKDADVYIIESNHDEEKMKENLNGEDSSENEKTLFERISKTHLNTTQTIEYLQKCIGENTKQVILMHLSPTNQKPEILMGQVRNKLKFKKVSFVHPKKHDLLKQNWTLGFEPMKLWI